MPSLYLVRVAEGMLLFIFGLLLMLLAQRLRDIRRALHAKAKLPWRDSWNDFRKTVLPIRELTDGIRLIHAFALMFVVFIHLKHLIPILRSKMYDSPLLAMEMRVFGVTAAERAQSLLGAESAFFWSAVYLAFYPYLALLCASAALVRPRSLGERLAAELALVWLVGILFVYAIPTLGPCFVRPEILTGLPSTDVSRMQLDLLKNKLFLESHPFAQSGVYLISGFPSLHLAVPIAGTIFFRSLGKSLFVASLVFTALTAVSTIFFGWHYLIDDVGSIALVLVARLTTTALFFRRDAHLDGE